MLAFFGWGFVYFFSHKNHKRKKGRPLVPPPQPRPCVLPCRSDGGQRKVLLEKKGRLNQEVPKVCFLVGF